MRLLPFLLSPICSQQSRHRLSSTSPPIVIPAHPRLRGVVSSSARRGFRLKAGMTRTYRLLDDRHGNAALLACRSCASPPPRGGIQFSAAWIPAQGRNDTDISVAWRSSRQRSTTCLSFLRIPACAGWYPGSAQRGFRLKAGMTRTYRLLGGLLGNASLLACHSYASPLSKTESGSAQRGFRLKAGMTRTYRLLGDRLGNAALLACRSCAFPPARAGIQFGAAWIPAQGRNDTDISVA